MPYHAPHSTLKQLYPHNTPVDPEIEYALPGMLLMLLLLCVVLPLPLLLLLLFLDALLSTGPSVTPTSHYQMLLTNTHNSYTHMANDITHTINESVLLHGPA